MSPPLLLKFSVPASTPAFLDDQPQARAQLSDSGNLVTKLFQIHFIVVLNPPGTILSTEAPFSSVEGATVTVPAGHSIVAKQTSIH